MPYLGTVFSKQPIFMRHKLAGHRAGPRQNLEARAAR